MLKLATLTSKFETDEQPLPRGCVLKLYESPVTSRLNMQPLPRGCVLKPDDELSKSWESVAAASARLCVETENQRGLIKSRHGSRFRAAVC